MSEEPPDTLTKEYINITRDGDDSSSEDDEKSPSHIPKKQHQKKEQKKGLPPELVSFGPHLMDRIQCATETDPKSEDPTEEHLVAKMITLIDDSGNIVFQQDLDKLHLTQLRELAKLIKCGNA